MSTNKNDRYKFHQKLPYIKIKTHDKQYFQINQHTSCIRNLLLVCVLRTYDTKKKTPTVPRKYHLILILIFTCSHE